MSVVVVTTVSADCELLGRGPVQGSADSDSLAALVRQLCKQQQRTRLPGRRCTVSCSRDAGLEIVPCQPLHRRRRDDCKRPDDEGFESDEDLASLGSYEDPGKRKPGVGGGGGGASAVASAAAAAGASSDSANSSGVSEDSDDADAASLKGQPPPVDASAAGDGRETYGLADVAFCHTDAAALPGVAVWVIKTRRAPHAAGLEAIVFRGGRDCGRLQDVCRAYQEHSRRLKLEPKPWAAAASQASSAAAAAGQQPYRRGKVVGGGGSTGGGIIAVTLTAVPEPNRYNLVQRTDTDGVTHIEVTAGPAVASSGAKSPSDFRRAAKTSAGRDGQSPSSIISLSTPESPRPTPRAAAEDEVGATTDGDSPPQRPERRKYKPKPDNDEADDDDGGDDDCGRRQQKVVRGQFIRVNVNHCAALPPASPEPVRTGNNGSNKHQESSAKPAAGTAASDRLWSTADYDRLDGRYEYHRSSSRTNSRTRSRSTGPGRRQQYPLLLTAAVQQQQHPPAVVQPFSRYQTAEYQQQQQQQQSSFGTRFFGKLREITSSTTGNQDLQPVTFRRRNSVGESATANFHQYFSHHHHQHQQPQHHQHHHNQQYQQYQQYQNVQPQRPQTTKNLKSVIKKNNKSQPYQHAFDEPKKVTFSAYATVQVVD